MIHRILYGILLLAGTLFVFSSCKKTVENKVSPPSWSFSASGQYPYTMTAVVMLPFALRSETGANDELGAFINNECRGVATIQSVGNFPVYFILIHGSASEQGQITFKYYNALKSIIYASPAAVPFQIDSSYGMIDAPQVLELQKQ